MKTSSLKQLAVATSTAAVMTMITGTGIAQTTTLDMDVSITLTDACELQANGTDMPFGTHQILNGVADVTYDATFDWRCSNDTEANIGINEGLGTGATVSTRFFEAGGINSDYNLPYELHKVAALNENWGNTPCTDTLDVTGIGMATGDFQTETIYGVVRGSEIEQAAVGDYLDTVTIEVTFGNMCP